jgi:hypothetical protein
MKRGRTMTFITPKKYSRELLAAVAQNREWPMASNPQVAASQIAPRAYTDADYAHWQKLAEQSEPDELWEAFLEWKGIIGFGSELKRHCLELFAP